MNFKINQLSDFSLQILKNNPFGYIHSVYHKTVNICINEELLALQSAYSTLSPISLISNINENEFIRLNANVGETVKITDSSIFIGSSCLNFSFVEIIPCLLDKELSAEDINILYKNIQSVIFSTHTGGFDTIFKNSINDFSPLISPSLQVARNYIFRAYQNFKNEQYSDSVALLTKLIGLGTGLTPSGDDFLCGILAGLILSGQSCSFFTIKLKESITLSLKNTNDISCAFLRCALNNRFSLPINSLTKLPSLDYILSSFTNIGHSSGVDTLCGVFFAFSLFIENNNLNLKSFSNFL